MTNYNNGPTMRAPEPPPNYISPTQAAIPASIARLHSIAETTHEIISGLEANLHQVLSLEPLPGDPPQTGAIRPTSMTPLGGMLDEVERSLLAAQERLGLIIARLEV